MTARQYDDTATTQRSSHKKLSSSLATFASAKPQTIYLLDGEVVVYRRSRSLLYQSRYKLADGTWYKQTTRKASVEHAIAVACNLYNEAMSIQRLSLAHQTHTFAQIAAITPGELRLKIDASTGRTAYPYYVSCSEKYFLPNFANQRLEELSYTDIQQFEAWRNSQMRRVPKTSTLMNFAGAWNRLLRVAVARGCISKRMPVPKLTTRGEKGTTRPAFSAE